MGDMKSDVYNIRSRKLHESRKTLIGKREDPAISCKMVGLGYVTFLYSFSQHYVTEHVTFAGKSNVMAWLCFFCCCWDLYLSLMLGNIGLSVN